MQQSIPAFESLSPEVQAMVLQSQRDEETGALIYEFMAKREKN